jgi:hypothetical protein
MLSFYKKALHCYGKLRRAYFAIFCPTYIRRNLEKKTGTCLRCGACCKLLFLCPWYREENGEGKCAFYEQRPYVCKLFPIDKFDLIERDLVMPQRRCGFSFTRLRSLGTYKVYRIRLSNIGPSLKIAKDMFLQSSKNERRS